MTSETIRGAFQTATFGLLVEHYPVSVSVSSVAQSWLRQREAPHGALVVADTEIAPRGRLGQNWKTVDGISAAVVVRPSVSASAEDLLWLVALVAGCVAYRSTGHEVAAWWPDRLMLNDRQVGLITVDTQLGPGVVTAAVLSFQLDVLTLVPTTDDRLEYLAALMLALESLFAGHPEDVIDQYEGVDYFRNRPIVARLKPRGTVIGVSAGIDTHGRLIVEGAERSRRSVSIDQLVSVEIDQR